MTDWADERAREWWKGRLPITHSGFLDSLAALLREVGITRAAYRDQLLAEVRRVVTDVQKSIWGAPTDNGSAVTLCCDEILSRLEALK